MVNHAQSQIQTQSQSQSQKKNGARNSSGTKQNQKKETKKYFTWPIKLSNTTAITSCNHNRTQES